MEEPLLVDGPATSLAEFDDADATTGPEVGGGDANGLLLDMNRLISSLEYSSRLASERSEDASDMASKRC